MRAVRLLGVAAMVAASFVVATSPPAGATITVTTTVDESNVDGDCSLREAVESVNTGTPVDACLEGTGPIILPPGTYDVASDLQVTTAVSVEGSGAGATVLSWSGGGGSLFDIDLAGDFALSGVTMTGGPTYYVNKQCTNSSSITVTDSALEGSDNYGINGCTGRSRLLAPPSPVRAATASTTTAGPCRSPTPGSPKRGPTGSTPTPAAS